MVCGTAISIYRYASLGFETWDVLASLPREAEVLGVMKPTLSLSIYVVLSVKIILPLSTPVDGR